MKSNKKQTIQILDLSRNFWYNCSIDRTLILRGFLFKKSKKQIRILKTKYDVFGVRKDTLLLKAKEKEDQEQNVFIGT